VVAIIGDEAYHGWGDRGRGRPPLLLDRRLGDFATMMATRR